MNRRAKAVRRTKQPLQPLNAVQVVTGNTIITLAASQITTELVGQKAFGLASIPTAWTRPFFVVSGTVECDSKIVEQALTAAGIDSTQAVMVRSSAIDETMDRRGSLISGLCQPNDITAKIRQLRRILQERGKVTERLHWVVQAHVNCVALGHLSNERRLSEAQRDWTAEVEPYGQNRAERHRIAIRPWRDAERKECESHQLKCPYRANYIDRLEDVARWAYGRQIRVHFEWVWDGKTLYVVQADPCDNVPNGVNPETLVQSIPGAITAGKLQLFRVATAHDFQIYRKLANAQIYSKLGYSMPSFYVLDDQDEIRNIIATGNCSPKLNEDLNILTQRPLVIRTDGVPREMLPRSDELRSVEGAVQWLQHNFKDAVQKAGLQRKKLCLLAHHFVPATASAWCQASPDGRRVRIESLWGIPEGIYWYAHDVFDVDTKAAFIPKDAIPPKKLTVRERRRYKSRFVAPNSEGAWVVQRASENADWRRSIRRTEWIEEIAWTTRRIAQEEQKSVAVMWFVDVSKEVSKHKVLPWFHSEWVPKGTIRRAAPREKSATIGEFKIETQGDWKRLQLDLSKGEKFSRVVVNPNEPEMVRNDDFALSLAEISKRNNLVVELAGGILSHAYYLLTSHGCIVECIDLDDYALEDDRLEFNKLVRDLIPASIEARGEGVDICKLEGEALIVALRQKLVEEAYEVMDAPTTKQIAEELADVREVMLAIAQRLSISESEIEAARVEKAQSRGGFQQGLMLSRTTLNAQTVETKEDLLSEERVTLPRTVSAPTDLPAPTKGIHPDKRIDEQGVMERLFTISLPIHIDTLDDLRTVFSMETQGNQSHEMLLDINLERSKSDIRLRVKLINTQTPKQLELDFLHNDHTEQET